MILINKRSNAIISENLQVADTFLKRLKGLMFAKEFPLQDSLLIIPCNEIHTFFMNFSIDVLYLDLNNNIVSIDENLQPGKIGKRVKNAISIIELPRGKIKEKDIKVGQIVGILNK